MTYWMDQKETLGKRGNLNDSLYFLYMKSLKESLFDKDLADQNPEVFGNKYSVRCVLVNDDDYTHGGQSYSTKEDEYKWLLNTVKLGELKRNVKNPVKIDNKKNPKAGNEYILGWRTDEKFCEVIGYIVAIINSMPIDHSQTNRVNPVNMKDLRSKLTPYLKNMGGSPMCGTGGNFYFTQSGLRDYKAFELYRKDKRFIIIFDEK